MSERKTLIERVRDAGQAIVAVAVVAGFIGGFATKAWGWFKAGPEAKQQVASVDQRLTKVERQMRFVVFAAEKTTRTTYRDWSRAERSREPRSDE